jgi:uncharacterized Zn-binding protein involved in type VI secretion
MSTPVVTEDDTFAQACKVHALLAPCVGAYSGSVLTPGQSGFTVNGKKVVLAQQVHTYGCPACSSNRVIVNVSAVLKVNGISVALAGAVTGLHVNGSIGGNLGLKA